MTVSSVVGFFVQQVIWEKLNRLPKSIKSQCGNLYIFFMPCSVFFTPILE
jgi:hypothetical protein